MKCPICMKYRGNKSEIISHMERQHREQLPKDISTYRYAYLLEYGRDYSLCTVCGNKTEWNDVTQKPNRLCGRKECRDSVRKAFKKNMDRVYGEGHYPVNDPEFQKTMLRNKKSSKPYIFKDGGEIIVASKDEYELLSFLETVLEMGSNDVVECPFIFYYMDNGEKRAYLPDFYLPNYNLIIEQKDENNQNPEFLKETRYKVKLKLEAVQKENKYNYIIVYGRNYDPLMEIINKIKESDGFGDNKKLMKQAPIFIHNETAAQLIGDKKYFGIIFDSQSNPVRLFLTEHFNGEIIYVGVDNQMILPRTLSDFADYSYAQIYEIKTDDPTKNKYILNELKNGIVLNNTHPNDFILSLLMQHNISIHITNEITNNDSGENNAHLVNVIKFNNMEDANANSN